MLAVVMAAHIWPFMKDNKITIEDFSVHTPLRPLKNAKFISLFSFLLFEILEA